MKQLTILFFACLTSCFILSACSSSYLSISETLPENVSDSRYKDKNDSMPTKTLKADEIEDITPKNEEPSAGGNKDYEVWGKKYQVLNSSEGYSATGIASWYGAKFHNHKTSNGETYDMYQLSAAHRSLPLPTYVKVTNLGNNKTVIVRVNDRGPFHEERLLDLSYAAAVKLDFINNGTAKVKIEAVEFKQELKNEQDKPTKTKKAIEKPVKTEVESDNVQYFLQLAAFNDKPSAQDYAQKIKVNPLLINQRLIIESAELHRVKVGPLNKVKATNLRASLKLEYQIRAFLLFD